MTYQDAVRKARFGHRDWIYYRSDGQSVFALASAQTVKTAMLATGTQGSWTLISANDGIGLKMSWPIAMNVYRQFVKGWR